MILNLVAIIGWEEKTNENAQTMLLRGLLGEILGSVDDEKAIGYAQNNIRKLLNSIDSVNADMRQMILNTYTRFVS